MDRIKQLSTWLHRAMLTGGAQAIVQLVGFLSGLVIIRNLTPDQYALYTIATSLLGVATVLTDGGVVNAVIAQGGQVWQDRGKFSAVLAAGLALRKKLAIVAVALALPVLLVLLRRQGATWTETVAISIAIFPLFFVTIRGQLLEAVLRLHQDLLPLQRIQIGANLGRLAIVALTVMQFPLAAAALMAGALPQWWTNWRLRLIADRHVDRHAAPSKEVQAKLFQQVRRTIPGAVYYALSSQITVWLASIFGNAGSVAAVGALGRLVMILNVLGAVFNIIAIPRFARLPAGEYSLVRKRFWQINASLAAACAVPIAAMVLAPGPVLQLIGPNYAGFEREATLMAIGGVVSMMSALTYFLGATRGVLAPPMLAIPYCIAIQALLVVLLPVDTIMGVIWIGLLNAAGQWALNLCYYLWATARREASPPTTS